MARPEVPDTTMLIRLARSGQDLSDFYRRLAGGRLWLSAVVAAEFLAGARSPADAALIQRLVAILERIDRLLTPTANEWRLAGQLIARRVRLHGPLRPRDHLADVLILVTAARVGGTVISANVRHFAPWAALARRAGLDVQVVADPADAREAGSARRMRQ